MDDREPWAAVGAVGERIAETAVGGVKQLVEAVAARRRVDADGCVHARAADAGCGLTQRRHARADLKAALTARLGA